MIPIMNMMKLRVVLVQFLIFDVTLSLSLSRFVQGYSYYEIDNTPDFMKLNGIDDFDYEMQEHQRKNVFINQNILNIHNQVARKLSTLNPDTVCEGYNNATKGKLTCQCQKYNQTKAVIVNCTYDGEQCNDDKTFCYDGYITTVIEGRDPNITITNGTTSCTNITTATSPQFVCIRVLSNMDGTFSPLGSCSAQYNGVTCNSCNSCIPANVTNASALNQTYISINCCNVVQDKKQTCASISDSGITIQQFDYVRPGDEGQCKSNAVRNTSFWVSMMICFFVASALFW